MKETAERILSTYRFGSRPIYVVGSFDVGVTVYSQQIRGLNLAWALTQSGFLRSKGSRGKKRIAIIGGGFSGLSVAAGLMRREVAVDITIFEQRDTLLPLQHGSDTRWLHPRIYDWPSEGSQASAAMLPVLNWTAGRASDVVVQVLRDWASVVKEAEGSRRHRLFCNTRHIQIAETARDLIGIEWVGEERKVYDATANRDAPIGTTEFFDAVILAIGFGLEKDDSVSYWRNDVSGQPSLENPRRVFLISGQGDGAMIDLLRLRISQFRQDRILEEVFREAPDLMAKVKSIYDKTSDLKRVDIFSRFNGLVRGDKCRIQFESAKQAMTRRLRRDTNVVLHLNVKKLSDIFNNATCRISFQNKFLVYLLYRCGAFIPSSATEESIVSQYGIATRDIIRRHGTLRDAQFESVLSKPLFTELSRRRGGAIPDPLSQRDDVLWPGGYFAFGSARGGDAKAFWRKEYLPGPTNLLAGAFCSTIAGFLEGKRSGPGRIRVTLHRAIVVGEEELLQQCCNYPGAQKESVDKSTAARTFPARNATIGVAYRTRKVVRSITGVAPHALEKTMQLLALNDASRDMSGAVTFVLAIPFLEPEKIDEFTAPSPVAAILYIDAADGSIYIDNGLLLEILKMCQYFIDHIQANADGCDRINNIKLNEISSKLPPTERLVEGLNTLEVVQVEPPHFSAAFQLNFDHTDFVQVEP